MYHDYFFFFLFIKRELQDTVSGRTEQQSAICDGDIIYSVWPLFTVEKNKKQGRQCVRRHATKDRRLGVECTAPAGGLQPPNMGRLLNHWAMQRYIQFYCSDFE